MSSDLVQQQRHSPWNKGRLIGQKRPLTLVRLKVDDVCFAGKVRERATVVQKKTGRPVQFELTEQTRASLQDGLAVLRVNEARFLFPSRICKRCEAASGQQRKFPVFRVLWIG